MSDLQTNRETMAKEYDAIHNRLFLLQILVLGTLLAVYQFSGASAALANGLEGRFGLDQWYFTNAVYIVVSIFGFAAFMSPFSFYSNHVLELHFGLSDDTVADWASDFIRSLVIDLLLATLLFSVIYALLRWIPEWWWLAASFLYIAIVIVIATLAPIALMPLLNKFEPIDEGELKTAIREMLSAADLSVFEISKWSNDRRADAAHVMFTGFGKKRQLVLGDLLLGGFKKDEILAVITQEVGHLKNQDTMRLMFVSSALALVGFYIADICLAGLISFFDIPSIYNIGAAPVFLFSLFLFSLISMPFANLYSRHREFAADAYTVQQTRAPEALISAFEKFSDQHLSNKDPAPWVEFLLNSHPSMTRRIERLRSLIIPEANE